MPAAGQTSDGGNNRNAARRQNSPFVDSARQRLTRLTPCRRLLARWRRATAPTRCSRRCGIFRRARRNSGRCRTWVRPELAAAYAAKGIEKLYSHQAAAAELAHAGKNFVVVTPTASGKTLCYNLPVLNAVLENPDTRALYLFPTKALAQDQLAGVARSCHAARRPLWRVHLRRRHAERRAQSDPRARARDPFESGHAAHRNPAAPHEMDAAVREFALHRAR